MVSNDGCCKDGQHFFVKLPHVFSNNLTRRLNQDVGVKRMIHGIGAVIVGGLAIPLLRVTRGTTRTLVIKGYLSDFRTKIPKRRHIDMH